MDLSGALLAPSTPLRKGQIKQQPPCPPLPASLNVPH